MTTPTDPPFLGPRRAPSPRRLARMIRWPRLTSGRTDPLETAVDIDDLRRMARRSTPRPVFDFIDGGAGDENALRRNERGFADARVVPRVLRDVSSVDPSTVLFDRPLSSPMILGPVGMTRLAHAHGEIGAARAASRAGIPYTLSTMSSTAPEEVAAHGGDGDRWFQLYLWRDREASKRLIDRAIAAGYSTLVMTVDVPVGGLRLRDARNGMTFPPRLTLRSTARIATHPRWWLDSITRDPVRLAVLQNESGEFTSGVNRIFDAAVTLDDLAWLREAWPGTLLVKGVLDPDDAVAAVARGADGIVVSNHGGRQLENTVTALEVLPAIRSILPSTPLIVDGGIRSGGQIAVAIAAGADAVLIGRAYLYGLMAGGERGADRALEILRSGLERTMALCGTDGIDALHEIDVRL